MSTYRTRDAGIREIARSTTSQGVMYGVASGIAQRANSADPDGRYRAARALVPSGWEHEDRAGARVTQTEFSHRSWRIRALRSAIGEY